MVVTVYEVICHGREGGRVVRWAAWAKVLKELSQVLLVAYSALNPIAYCGDLVYRLALHPCSYNEVPLYNERNNDNRICTGNSKYMYNNIFVSNFSGRPFTASSALAAAETRDPLR